MSKCKGVIELHAARITVKKIKKNWLKESILTIYEAVAKYKEPGNAKNCPRSGYPRSACINKNIEAVRFIVNTDLNLSP